MSWAQGGMVTALHHLTAPQNPKASINFTVDLGCRGEISGKRKKNLDDLEVMVMGEAGLPVSVVSEASYPAGWELEHLVLEFRE